MIAPPREISPPVKETGAPSRKEAAKIPTTTVPATAAKSETVNAARKTPIEPIVAPKKAIEEAPKATATRKDKPHTEETTTKDEGEWMEVGKPKTAKSKESKEPKDSSKPPKPPKEPKETSKSAKPSKKSRPVEKEAPKKPVHIEHRVFVSATHKKNYLRSLKRRQKYLEADLQKAEEEKAKREEEEKRRIEEEKRRAAEAKKKEEEENRRRAEADRVKKMHEEERQKRAAEAAAPKVPATVPVPPSKAAIGVPVKTPFKEVFQKFFFSLFPIESGVSISNDDKGGIVDHECDESNNEKPFNGSFSSSCSSLCSNKGSSSFSCCSSSHSRSSAIKAFFQDCKATLICSFFFFFFF
jgi:hypothetical protein